MAVLFSRMSGGDTEYARSRKYSVVTREDLGEGLQESGGLGIGVNRRVGRRDGAARICQLHTAVQARIVATHLNSSGLKPAPNYSDHSRALSDVAGIRSLPVPKILSHAAGVDAVQTRSNLRFKTFGYILQSDLLSELPALTTANHFCYGPVIKHFETLLRRGFRGGTGLSLRFSPPKILSVFLRPLLLRSIFNNFNVPLENLVFHALTIHISVPRAALERFWLPAGKSPPPTHQAANSPTTHHVFCHCLRRRRAAQRRYCVDTTDLAAGRLTPPPTHKAADYIPVLDVSYVSAAGRLMSPPTRKRARLGKTFVVVDGPRRRVAAILQVTARFLDVVSKKILLRGLYYHHQSLQTKIRFFGVRRATSPKIFFPLRGLPHRRQRRLDRKFEISRSRACNTTLLLRGPSRQDQTTTSKFDFWRFRERCFKTTFRSSELNFLRCAAVSTNAEPSDQNSRFCVPVSEALSSTDSDSYPIKFVQVHDAKNFFSAARLGCQLRALPLHFSAESRCSKDEERGLQFSRGLHIYKRSPSPISVDPA
ncbi:hypothetical protein R3P38DRAFT_3365527 [Favolaschia claudopus]|uniref:Uncharacterized protein n=1 Tax=Favolaschia claudopus TaxID=2862362 RepID=A0AAW0AG02_9AGAR